MKNLLAKFLLSTTLIFAAVSSFALDHGALRDALVSADSPKEVQQVLKRFDVMSRGDLDLAQLATQIAYKPAPTSAEISALRQAVEIRALASGSPPAAKNLERLSELKNSPLYHDPGVQYESNWLEKSMESLGRWIRNLFDFDRGRIDAPNGAPGIEVPEFVTQVVWILIGALVIGAVFFVMKTVVSNRSKASRKKSLVSEDEVTLSADEWLKRADALIQIGEHREAVRCLYVACLLRLDQSSILEFRRQETNWEHLGRYHELPRKPAFNLTTPTREFDLIWYGHRLKGREDAEKFRGYYEQLLDVLKRGRQAA